MIRMTTPVSIIKSDDIWFKNFHVLFKIDRLVEFFPNKMQTLDERMNSIVRLGIYSSLLLSAYKRNISYLAWIIVVFILTYIIYKNYNKEKFEEETKELISILKKKQKITPTYNNPFMNTTMADYTENPDKDEVENYYQDTADAEKTREDINDKFNYNLYQSVEDVYEKNNSRRQFYTTPNTQIPSDQDKYLDFLYGDMKSCKTNVEDCTPYNDLRRNPPVFPNQEENPVTSN